MKKKVFLSLLILTLALLSFIPFFDTTAQKILDDSLQRAFVAFGLAKALNAVISLLQGTELSLTPAGIGVNLSVGELLDPFNDMVERFSWVMLLSSVSLGIQKILLLLGGKLFIKVAIGVVGAMSVVLVWIQKKLNTALFLFMLKTFLFLLLLRFFAVVFLFSSQLLYTSLLHQEYVTSTQQIEQTKEYLQEFEESTKANATTEQQSSISDYFSKKYDQIQDALHIDERFKNLDKKIDTAYSGIINLITLFIFQTILFPLLFFWIFILLLKKLFAIDLLQKSR